MPGFSFDLPMTAAPAAAQPRCGLCKLHKACNSPKMAADLGTGKLPIMVVGEAPGADEDDEGRPFVGRTGRLLRKACKRAGFALEDCVVTNAVACRPAGNRTPDADEVSWCRPKLLQDRERHKPAVVILLGAVAVKSVIGHLWQEDCGGSFRWAGQTIPDRRWNAWVCPTFHPSFVARAKTPVEEMFFERHLKRAFALAQKGRPYTGDPPPDDSHLCKALCDPDEAAAEMESFLHEPLWAFDYETNCLKPDGPGARIASIAFGTPERAVSGPWIGEVKKVTKRLLASKAKKVAANAKFELRWSAAFGMKVRNFHWDTMIAAKVIDQRKEAAGLKYRAYVHFGHPAYADEVEPYLTSDKAKGGANSLNRVFDCPLPKLLVYNALDALLEAKLYAVQDRLLPAGGSGKEDGR